MSKAYDAATEFFDKAFEDLGLEDGEYDNQGRSKYNTRDLLPHLQADEGVQDTSGIKITLYTSLNTRNTYIVARRDIHYTMTQIPEYMADEHLDLIIREMKARLAYYAAS